MIMRVTLPQGRRSGLSSPMCEEEKEDMLFARHHPARIILAGEPWNIVAPEASASAQTLFVTASSSFASSADCTMRDSNVGSSTTRIVTKKLLSL